MRDNRERLQQLRDACAEGRLTAEEQAEFERLATPEQLAEAREEAAIVSALRSAGREWKAPPGLLASALHEAAKTSPARKSARILPVWAPLAAAAAAVLLVLVAGGIMLMQDRGSGTTMDAALEPGRTSAGDVWRDRAGAFGSPLADGSMEDARIPGRRPAAPPRASEGIPLGEPAVAPYAGGFGPATGTLHEPAQPTWTPFDVASLGSRSEVARLVENQRGEILLDTGWLDTALSLAREDEEFAEARPDPVARFLVVELEHPEARLREMAFIPEEDIPGLREGRLILPYRPDEAPSALSRRGGPAPMAAPLMDEEAPAEPATGPQTMMAPADEAPAPAPEERLFTGRAESAFAREASTTFIETFDDFLAAIEERGAEFLFFTRYRRPAFLADEAEPPDDTPLTPGSVVRGFLVFRFGSREQAEQAFQALRGFHGPGVGQTELHSAELLYETGKTRLIVPYHMQH